MGRPNNCLCVFHKICIDQWSMTRDDEATISCPECKTGFAFTEDLFGDSVEEVKKPIPESRIPLPVCAASRNNSEQNFSNLKEAFEFQLKKEYEKCTTTPNHPIDEIDLDQEDLFFCIHVRRSCLWKDTFEEIMQMEESEWRP